MPLPKSSWDCSRIPPWLKRDLPRGRTFADTERLLSGLELNTVCQGAKCPNKWECFGRGTAAFLVLGRVCTRNCRFCNITPGRPEPVDPGESARLAQAASRMGLKHVVVTSVTRDDLPDGGASHFAACVDALRQALPSATLEVLIPDFQGDGAALDTVLAARPHVLNHNVETVPRLYPSVRPQALYERSLELLRRAAQRRPDVTVKSGLMVGLGEDMEEVRAVIRDLKAHGCGMVTVGQYMRPSRLHLPVARWVEPEEFEALAAYGRELGIRHMFCAPLVRSSYQAGGFVAEAREAAARMTPDPSTTPASS